MPAWGTTAAFSSITRTTDELSVVCRQDVVAEGVQCEKGWRCLRVAGVIDFSLTGVLSSMVMPLAGVGITVFALSTFDTDYVLVKQADFDRAVDVLRNSGHSVE
jgi:hypothetical protein